MVKRAYRGSLDIHVGEGVVDNLLYYFSDLEGHRVI